MVAAFNEFCSPNIEEALEDVCRKGYDTIIIVLHDAHSRGFFHSEEEILSKIKKISTKHRKRILYMWPFNVEDID